MGASGQDPGAEPRWGREGLGDGQAGAADGEAVGLKSQVKTMGSWCCLDAGEQRASKRGRRLAGHPHSLELGHGVGVDPGCGSSKPTSKNPLNGGEGVERGRKRGHAWNVARLSG